MLYLAPHSKDIALLKPERRQFPRRSSQDPVVVVSPAGAFGGDITDVSATGILLFLQSAIAPGSSVGLLFDRRTQAGNGRYPIRCVGTVVRVQPLVHGYATAVAFQRIEMVQK
jgi:hypothetical protein